MKDTFQIGDRVRVVYNTVEQAVPWYLGCTGTVNDLYAMDLMDCSVVIDGADPTPRAFAFDELEKIG